MKHIAIAKEVIDGSETNSVLSTDLHNHLEVKTEHGKWAKRLIEKYEFIENSDYLTVAKKVGRQISTEYVFSIDMAKEVCMVSNTDKGRETRKYFIKVEKQHSKNTLLSLNDHIAKTQALFVTQEVMGEVITDHDKRLETLEKNVRMESWQERNLMDAKNSKVYELAGDDKAMANKLHRKVWQLFKKRFHLPRYNELKFGQYEDGLIYIDGLTLSDMVG